MITLLPQTDWTLWSEFLTLADSCVRRFLTESHLRMKPADKKGGLGLGPRWDLGSKLGRKEEESSCTAVPN